MSFSSEYETTEEWNRIRKQVFIRDGHECVLCHSNRKLVAHHTRRKLLLENLMTLCKQCHEDYTRRTPSFKKRLRILNDLRLRKDSERIEIQMEMEMIYCKLIDEISKYVKTCNRNRILTLPGGRKVLLKNFRPLILSKEYQTNLVND